MSVAGLIPLQISGGEPTLHPQLPEVVAEARRRGFRNIELVTNGMIISANPDFLSALVDQGLTAVYLQFDGLRKQTCRSHTRPRYERSTDQEHRGDPKGQDLLYPRRRGDQQGQ